MALKRQWRHRGQPSAALLAVAVTACGAAPTAPAADRSYILGGNISGLAGTLVLSNQGVDMVAVRGNGPFAFARTLVAGTAYQVTVVMEPSVQRCQVDGGSGTVAEGGVADGVEISCADRSFALAGRLEGAVAPIDLSVNSLEVLAGQANGPFRFATQFAAAASYEVAAQGQGQSCQVQGGRSFFANSDVDDVRVACTPLAYRLGGTSAGVGAGEAFTIAYGDARQVVVGSGSFELAGGAFFAAPLTMALVAHPAGKSCELTGVPARMPAGDLLTLSVRCESVPAAQRHDFALSGTLEGAAGAVTVELAGHGSQTLVELGPFRLPFVLDNAEAFQLAVTAAPAGQSCTVTPASGTIADADVTNVLVHCDNLAYPLGGVVTGLDGGRQLVLALGHQQQTLAASGPFTLAAPVPYQQPYQVTIAGQPAGLRCALAGESGVMPAHPVADMVVTCRPFLRLTTGQAAIAVLGQPGIAVDLKAAPSALSLGAPVALYAAPDVALAGPPPTIAPGALYVSDWLYGRVATFAERPDIAALPAAADFALGGVALDDVVTGPAGWPHPGGIAGAGGTLWLADSDHHRLVGWPAPPEENDDPTLVLGQADLTLPASPACTASRLNSPWAVSGAGNVLAVVDRGNHRVLLWRQPITASGQAADVVLGQPDFVHGTAVPAAARTMKSPAGVWTDGVRLVVADQGNSRVLGFNNVATLSLGDAADWVLGQPDFTTASRNSDETRSLPSPRGIAVAGDQLFISDDDHSRILVFDSWPSGSGGAADAALGAPTLNRNYGCNLGLSPAVGAQTLCQPAGMQVLEAQLWVADCGNARVVIYDGNR